MATGRVPSEMIEGERKKLLEILQRDPDSILDSLTSRRLISEAEYEILEAIPDPLKKSRKLLILVQKKGEVSCQHFLKCLFSTFPESATIWGLRHESLKHENTEPSQSTGISKNSEDLFSPEEKQSENSEVTVPFGEKEHLHLENPEMITDKTSYQEMIWSSRGNEKEHSTPTITLPHSVEDDEHEFSATIDYLQDGQRYDEPDDSLYLGHEEYLESVMYSEEAESIVEEEENSDPEHLVDGEEDPACSESLEFSNEEQSYGDSETGMSLEEEEEKSMEERKKVFNDVLLYLNMDRSRKLLPDFVKQFSLDRGCKWTPKTPGDFAWNFLVKVQALDVTARDVVLRCRGPCEDGPGELPGEGEGVERGDAQAIHPLDVLCACMLCADTSLQRSVLAGMHRCGFALPLLLPDAENNKSILMLGAMRDIVTKQLATPSGVPAGETGKPLTRLKMPVFSFVRLGDCSFSKSRILNALLSPARRTPPRTFLHQDLPEPVLPRQISDGLVEVAWCFPDSGGLKEDAPFPPEPVAVANLRGDLESFWTQFGFLMEISSAVFFFTDFLGEKEWNLLMLLGEAAIERCYFVLSAQARESEEAQIFQRVLTLKPSQLLFWEEEDGAGEKGRNIKGLQAALQEAMSSSLRRVSVEDMALLARELGIQVDQDFENGPGIEVSPSANLAVAVGRDGQPGHHQPESPSESTVAQPVEEPRAGREVSQLLQNLHLAPVFLPRGQNCRSPVRFGSPFKHAFVKAPWVMGSHFGSKQNSRVHSRGKNFGIQYFQPQRFCSDVRFMKFSGPARGQHMGGLLGRAPGPIFQRAPAWPGRAQTMGPCGRSAAVVPQVGHLCSLGPRAAGAVGRSQPRQAHAWGTQPTQASGKRTRMTSHPVDPHAPAFQSAGVRPVRPTFQQGFRLKTQGGPLNPAVHMGSHPMSNNKFLLWFNQPNPSQGKHSQPKPSQPMPSQPKPTQTKSTHPQPSQMKRPPPKPAQPKPCPPQSSQPRPAQPRPAQPKPSHTSRPQARASHARTGPKTGGKR